MDATQKILVMPPVWYPQGTMGRSALTEQTDILRVADGNVEEGRNDSADHNGIKFCRTSRHNSKSAKPDWGVN